MNTLLLSIISEGLKFLNKVVPEEAIKIQERLHKYETEWDAEIAKGEHRDDAKLDMLDRELQQCGELFLTVIKGQASKN